MSPGHSACRRGATTCITTEEQVRDWLNLAGNPCHELNLGRGAGLGGGLNLVQADYDNDGFIDVLVLRGAWLGPSGEQPNSLLRNRGDGTFEDVTVEAGIATRHPTQTAAWGDYNNDGWLDLR